MFHRDYCFACKLFECCRKNTQISIMYEDIFCIRSFNTMVYSYRTNQLSNLCKSYDAFFIYKISICCIYFKKKIILIVAKIPAVIRFSFKVTKCQTNSLKGENVCYTSTCLYIFAPEYQMNKYVGYNVCIILRYTLQ